MKVKSQNLIKQTTMLSVVWCLSLLLGCGRVWYSVAYSNNSAALVSAWTFIDGDTSVGINRVAGNHAYSIQLASINNQLYGSWLESSSGFANPFEIRAAVYTGSGAWSFIDGGVAAVGLNYIAASNAYVPSLASSNNILYAAWAEPDNGNNIRVKAFNGSAWSFVDGNTGNGLNFNGGTGAYVPNLVDLNGTLYVTWNEFNAGITQVRVARYNGASSWSFIDGGGANGINFNTAVGANNSVLEVFNNQLIATWNENDAAATQLRVAMYNGTSWSFIDGNTASGLNINTAQSVTVSTLTSCNGILFLSWNESNGANNEIRVKAYQGGQTWTSLDGGGTHGINYNPNQNAGGGLSGTCFRGTFYLSWDESNGVATQTRVAAWNKENWVFVDGDGTTGLNFNNAQNSTPSFLFPFQNYLMLGTSETSGVGNIRVQAGH